MREEEINGIPAPIAASVDLADQEREPVRAGGAAPPASHTAVAWLACSFALGVAAALWVAPTSSDAAEACTGGTYEVLRGTACYNAEGFLCDSDTFSCGTREMVIRSTLDTTCTPMLYGSYPSCSAGPPANIESACAPSKPGVTEVCGNESDDQCDDQVDEGCDPPGGRTPPGGNDNVLPGSSPGGGGGCPSCAKDPPPPGDKCEKVAGDDPILLDTRSAATEPLQDAAIDVAGYLGISRTYNSADVSVAGPNHTLGAPGIFGRGWHHDWESALTCKVASWSPSAGYPKAPTTICTVSRGLASGMRFLKTMDGTDLEGNAVELFERSDASKLRRGNQAVMLRRLIDNAFLVYLPNGAELHFATVCDASPTDRVCLDPLAAGGRARLVKVVDVRGNSVTVGYDRPQHVLLSLTDRLGHTLTLRDDAAHAGLATELRLDGRTVATYQYDGADGKNLARAVDADGKTIAAYEYMTASAGRLLTVRNEAGDPVVEFGYSTAGEATSLMEPNSSITVSYQVGSSSVVNTTGERSSTRTVYKPSAGQPASISIDGELLRTIGRDGAEINCTEEASSGVVTFSDLDTSGRVIRRRTFAPGVHSCSLPIPPSGPALNDEAFEYSATRPIAILPAGGIYTLSLDRLTRQTRTSVLASSKPGVSDPGVLEKIFDFDPAPRQGIADPLGYSCGVAGPFGSRLLCRVIESGLTIDLNGNTVRQRRATFYSHDEFGRPTGQIGPVLLDTQAYGAPVPTEQLIYWPDSESLDRRGQLRHRIQTASPGRFLTTSYDYSSLGVYQIIDPNGLATLMVRDGRGRVIRTVSPGGRVMETRYYAGQKPRIELVSDGSGGPPIQARRMAYDAKGRIAIMSTWSGDPDLGSPAPVLGWTQEWNYDDSGNEVRLTQRDASGTIQSERLRTFDGQRRPVVSRHPTDLTKQSSWTYEPDGYLGSQTDEDARTTEFVPDAMRRVQTVRRVGTDSAGSPSTQDVATYSYDPITNAIQSVTDGAGRATSYARDDFDQVRSVSSPATLKSGPVRFEHDARGNVVKKLHARVTETFEFDGLDRLTRQTASNSFDGQAVTYLYQYDEHADATPGGKGRLTRIVEPERTTSFFYDEAGHVRFEVLQEATVTTPLTTEHRYDPLGQLSTVIYPTGLTIAFTRDAATGAISEVRNGSTGTSYASAVSHLPFGPVQALTYPNGLTLTQTFNRRYEPSTVTVSSGVGRLLDLAYALSPAGDVRAIAEGAGTTSFSNDVLGRLTSFSLAPGASATPLHFTYAGDRVVSATDQATGVRRYAFAYDDQSNVTAISTYDATGASLTATLCLRHDPLSRITLVGLATANAGGPDALACRADTDVVSPIARFQYDARNRRVGRWSASTGAWTQYILGSDGSHLAELIRPGTSGGAWSVSRDYVWLDGRPVAQVEYPGPGAGEGYIYPVHLDAIGLPRVLTNSTGQAVWRAEARPYGDIGEVTTPDPASGRTVVTNLRLPGQYDERVFGPVGFQGPYYNWHRWYAPSTGRYLELDPLAMAGGFNGRYGPHWFGYVAGSPLGFTDPTGLSPLTGLSGLEDFFLKSVLPKFTKFLKGSGDDIAAAICASHFCEVHQKPDLFSATIYCGDIFRWGIKDSGVYRDWRYAQLFGLPDVKAPLIGSTAIFAACAKTCVDIGKSEEFKSCLNCK